MLGLGFGFGLGFGVGLGLVEGARAAAVLGEDEDARPEQLAAPLGQG